MYLREAHPSDGWQLPSNLRDGVVHESPADAEARGALARTCVKDLGIAFPALLDAFDDSTDEAYTGWPDRLYVIDRDGRVAYKSGPGPFGFDPEEMERALEAIVASPGAAAAPASAES